MKVYSPSQTQTWVQCPVKRMLAYNERWRPRTLGKRELAAVLGQAIGAGLAAYYSNPHATTNVASVAYANAVALMSQFESLGASVASWDQAQALATPERARQAVEKSVALDQAGRVLPATWRVLDVERTLPDHGHARIDLGVDDGAGPAVLDWKVKLSLKEIYRQKEVEKFRYSGQMYHYNWAYAQYVRSQAGAGHYRVFEGDFLPRFYIGLMVLEPKFSFELLSFDVSPEDHQKWLASARSTWIDMERDDFETSPPHTPRMAWEHEDNYGPCEFKKACFEYHWDPALMSNDYIQLPKRERS